MWLLACFVLVIALDPVPATAILITGTTHQSLAVICYPSLT